MKTEIKFEIEQSCLAFAKVLLTDGVTWKIAPTHSRNRVPSIFESKIGDCDISIVVGHIYYPNTWIMNCPELNIKEKELQCVTAESAAELAISHCKKKIQKMYKDFNICKQ